MGDNLMGPGEYIADNTVPMVLQPAELDGLPIDVWRNLARNAELREERVRHEKASLEQQVEKLKAQLGSVTKECGL
jgi:RecA/RadA recombinase